jgi:outer membrane murein-binding lipoprotein Lpp
VSEDSTDGCAKALIYVVIVGALLLASVVYSEHLNDLADRVRTLEQRMEWHDLREKGR